jgi:hypothetical protein
MDRNELFKLFDPEQVAEEMERFKRACQLLSDLSADFTELFPNRWAGIYISKEKDAPPRWKLEQYGALGLSFSFGSATIAVSQTLEGLRDILGRDQMANTAVGYLDPNPPDMILTAA